jgi:preprotein translocase subunit YajC
MLSLEVIVILVLLYCFFMYATLRAQRARRTSRELPTVQTGRVAEGKLV